MREAPARDGSIEISVICPVGSYVGDLEGVHRAFREVLAATGRSFEFVYVLDGPRAPAERALPAIMADEAPVRVFQMAKGFGEAAALQFGFENARGRYVLTITDRFQADPAGVPEILARLDAGAEVVVTRREPRSDALLNRVQARVFHTLVRWLSRRDFQDLTCGLRGMTAEAARNLDLYGDLHRFIPILAVRRGYRVEEIPVAQRREDRVLRVFGPGIYIRRLLDILNVFFLTRFVRKPLRFFGLVGLALGLAGFLISAVLAAMRVFGSASLANRPLLLLGVLLLVLGIQIISIGLIGEIIIFLGGRHAPPEVRELEGERH